MTQPRTLTPAMFDPARHPVLRREPSRGLLPAAVILARVDRLRQRYMPSLIGNPAERQLYCAAWADENDEYIAAYDCYQAEQRAGASRSR